MNQLLLKKVMKYQKEKKKGFTLVELIIVIAIIAILAAIAIPKFGEIRTSANERADLATAKNIATVVAAEIASNTISDTQTDADPTSLTDFAGTGTVSIATQIDGSLTPKNNPGTNTGFTITVSNHGNIEVDYAGSGTKVYPQD